MISDVRDLSQICALNLPIWDISSDNGASDGLGAMRPDGSMFCEGESLRVENIQKRPAWTIGAHDFDVPGIMLDDDPCFHRAKTTIRCWSYWRHESNAETFLKVITLHRPELFFIGISHRQFPHNWRVKHPQMRAFPLTLSECTHRSHGRPII